MRKLIWGKTFVRAIKRRVKKNPEQKANIDNTLRKLVEDPFRPELETHKLKGKLSGSWACTVDYDLRIIFDFVKSANHNENNIILLGIGTHDEVY